MNRSGSSDKTHLGSRKRFQNLEEPRSAKVKFEKGNGSQVCNPTCASCGKRHYGQCLLGIWSFFGCGKNRHKVRDFSTSDGKKVHFYAMKVDAPQKKRL